ncbi:hypothetical protein TSUD_206400 [Trifolium subterraneum]|uniref:uDENN domain-containing protein n=1 Tax=Trifolium subterraneum TaxID=3900 RepID=A0A2Z6MP76_TRISU|nr:hypothetical protein TSUD_206400 [Trifolium subterraneum]
MVVVGLHPNCDVQALHRQFVDRKLEGSGKLRSELGCQNQSCAESNIEPQVLFVYPPEKRLPLKCKDLLSFCFPGGLEVQAVERTPSMSALNEIFFGQEHLKQMDLSFVFRLQGSDNSTLYGCCILVEELVQKSSGLLSLISDKQSSYSSLRRYILTTQRCYCILSRLPFFELHFGVLNSIFTQERLEKLTTSVGDSNLEFVEGSYDEENSEGNSESVLVSDGIIDHPENLKVDGELQSYKERIDYDSELPTEHETDRTATKEESGPTISEGSDGQPENLTVDGELQSNKMIDYDSVLPNEHETERTTVKEESGPTISEDSDGQPENLMVVGDLHSYKEIIDCDSVVLTEDGTDRTTAKEETDPAISEDSDGHPEILMVDGELQSYTKRIDYDSVVPTEHETDRTTAKEESGPTISEDNDGQPENLAVDGELHSYKERIDCDSVVPTEHETDRTTATEESDPKISEDSDQNGDAFTTSKELEDRNLPNAILPLENDHGPLQIICKYYQLSCPARGSALTFHPLEHLHPLEYHRPAVTVLCRTGSTIDLKNFSTGLDLADAQNTLVVEEATLLSVWTIACLCGTLRLENVLTFLAGVLLEKQILVACCNLVGIKNKNKTSEAPSKFTNVIVVDANRNQVTSPTMPQLPRQKELISSLRPYHATLVGESYLGRRRPVYDCTEMQIGAAKGFLSVLRSYLDSLCYNIRSHTITNVQSNDDKVSLLLKESFIDSFPYRDRPFMKEMKLGLNC